MPKHRTLTDVAVKRLKTPETGQVDHFDSSYPGLVLRVSCGGRKTWSYFYRIGGKLKRMTLDNYPPMTVEEAHDAWRIARDTARAGRDPARKTEIGGTNFRAVFDEWMRRDQAGNKSAEEVRKKLEKDVLPHWEHRQISEIGRHDVLEVIDRIVDRGTVTAARRVHAYLHRLFGWAVGRGIIENNPLANMPKPGSETKRERVLSDTELAAVWNAANEIGHPYCSATRLLILTGARREEISQLRWSEIDGDTIKLSGARTKNGEPHTIPLSAPALELLARLPRISDLVFTYNGGKPIAAWGRAKATLDKACGVEGWRIHDLRRTVATGLQKLGVNLQTIEAVLGHTSGSRGGIVGVYQRHSFDAEKRAALEAWGAQVANISNKS